MFFTLTREEARMRLSPRGLVLVRTFHEGTTELGITPSGVEVILSPELDGTGSYEEEMIKAVEASLD